MRVSLAGCLLIAGVLCTSPPVATGTQDRPKLSLKQVIEKTEMVFLGTVAEMLVNAGPDFTIKAWVQVDATVFGDPSIKSIHMISQVQIPRFEVNEQRLVLIMRIRSRDEAKDEITAEGTDSWTFLAREGRVGPIDLLGEAEYQYVEQFIRKIQRYKAP